MIDKMDHKQPSEVLDYDVEFADWFTKMGDSDTLAAIESVVADSTGVVIESSAFTDDKVKVWISGGINQVLYKISVLVLTAAGRTKEKDFILPVKED